MVPMCVASTLFIAASIASRPARHRKTFGLIAIRRLTDSAASSASGSAPWVTALPTMDGIGMKSGSPLHVFG